MKKSIFVFVSITICLLLFSFYNLKSKNELNSSREIVLQFVTYNGYGNNLYIDNVLTGIQTDNDITVTSIVNIPYDTIYATQNSGIDSVAPIVTVSNIGRATTPDSVKIFLEINPGGYFDSTTIGILPQGQTTQVTFTDFHYSIGTGYFLKAFTSFAADSNRTNDTLRQYSISLPGYKRMVLYEEFTSNSSPACANNNGSLDAFVNRNFDSVAAIKYHTGILGRDTFYNANPVQSNARSRYYYNYAVPQTIADGKLPVSIPYGDSLNLYTPFVTRLSVGTPFSITVTDENVTDDSIRATVNINIISTVPAGNYRLRINAVERYVKDTIPGYDTLYGTNGEKNFYDIFRAMYPDTNGISIPAAVGNYQYQYTYYKEPYWVDSMIYTNAFIQNDNNREVMNCAKSRNIVFKNIETPNNVIYEKADLLNVVYDFEKNNYNMQNGSDSIQTFLNVELFESYFPPLGWKVFNQDGFITFQQYSGVSGPSIGGTKSVIMDFFDYNIPGQRDSMYSKVYRDLLSFDTVRFDYAYAQYTTTGTNIDSLTVNISTDGGLTFPFQIFRQGGLGLSTAPQTTTFFVPQNSTQWKTFRFSLNNIVSVNGEANNIPSQFILKQNYPNPFNPKTIISYELPVSGFVKLKIYDLLGKEIMTLINEHQTIGTYKTEFDGTGIASGIYFYSLSTDGFIDTKRMVLIK